jgi:Rha family phage regulatory protein
MTRSNSISKRKSAEAAQLVTVDHGELWTTSLLIAQKFGKRHDNVLRAVENLECSADFAHLNFEASEYIDSTGRTLPMYRITRDGFAFLAMGFTGRAAAEWKELFIGAFGRMARELQRIAANQALPEWQEARQLGKGELRERTDAVKALCERAHARLDSTTPQALWQTNAAQTITRALFVFELGEKVHGVRDRLSARQLIRMSQAELCYADAIEAALDSDLRHDDINAQAKAAVQAFAKVTGGLEVPGVDRRRARALALVQPLRTAI